MKKYLLSLILVLGLVTQGYCATGWDITKPAGTSAASDLDARVIENNTSLDLMLSTYRQGCALTYASASTLTIGSGGVMVNNSGGTVRLMVANAGAITGSWAMIDSGVEASSQTYYVYAVASGTTATTFTVLISTNSSAPTGATYYRRLGSFYNDASGNITQIVNDDNSGDIAFVKGQGNYYKIDSGSVAISSMGTASVSFDFTYAAAPIVVTNFGSATSDGYQMDITSISTTGCALQNINGHALTVYWIAIGQVLAQ